MTLASGRQHVIAWEDQEAVVAGVGATLRQYEADGRHVIEGYGPDEMCPAAVHGMDRWSSFDLVAGGASWVTLTHRVQPQPGHPFLLDVAIRHGLSDDGLRVDILVENRGRWTAPVGLGQHPCLLPLDGGLDGMVLQVPAGSRLPMDASGVPLGRVALDGGEMDFRAPRPVGRARLDVMYADLDRDADGVCSVVVRGGERALRLWMDDGFRYLAISSPHGPDGRSLTVAPMTCPPDALANGEDVAALDPGQSLRAAWGIEVLHR